MALFIQFIETNKLLKHARLFIIASKLVNRGSLLQRHCNGAKVVNKIWNNQLN